MADDQYFEGSCLCGAVTYVIRGQLSDVSACHCTQCRKQTGHHFATTDVRLADLTVQGEENISRFRASDFATRSFCSRCGSALFWQEDGADHLAVLAGTRDGETGLKTARHIFCADKGDYYSLDENIPQYAKDA